VASFSGQSTHDSEDETVSIAGTSTSTSSKSHSIQMSIKQNFQNVTSFSEGGDKFNRITNSILFLICKDMQPFNIVNNDGFQHLMKTVVPLYKLPSRDTFSRRLDNKYEAIAARVKEKLSCTEGLTITTDIWSDTMQTRSFLRVTIHFADKMKISSITLGVYDLTERHTANYLAEKLTETCERWNIKKEKITAVVTDSGANIVKAVDIAFEKICTYRVVHTL
jgi:hypothetical protein